MSFGFVLCVCVCVCVCAYVSEFCRQLIKPLSPNKYLIQFTFMKRWVSRIDSAKYKFKACDNFYSPARAWLAS